MLSRNPGLGMGTPHAGFVHGLADGQLDPATAGSQHLETGEKMKNLKLELHFAATAALCLAGAASADVVVDSMDFVNNPHALTISSLYLCSKCKNK